MAGACMTTLLIVSAAFAKKLRLLLLLSCAFVGELGMAKADQMILAVGAGGTEEYTRVFTEWSQEWKAVAEEADFPLTLIGIE